MQVERRADGALVMRPGTGRQRLLVATMHPAEIVIVCDYASVISCVRHYDEVLKKTVPCSCTGPCYSRRTDRFLGVLYRAGPTVWDERVLIVSDRGWSAMQARMLALHLDHSDIRGLRCIVQRHGDAVNGRMTMDVQERVKSVPDGFDLPAGVRNCLGIAADFFGNADGDLFPQETLPIRAQAATTPVSDAAAKPRVPLGRPRKKG